MRNAAVISVVDDNESVRTALNSLLRSNGYQVRTYAGALEFLDSSGPLETRCLISDMQMPGMCGVQLHQALLAMGLRIPVIFITGYPGEPARISPGTPGLVACLAKPFRVEELLMHVRAALSGGR